ncbi:hypothetical protein TKK_0016700 [Trichogramma kaykai]
MRGGDDDEERRYDNLASPRSLLLDSPSLHTCSAVHVVAGATRGCDSSSEKDDGGGDDARKGEGTSRGEGVNFDVNALHSHTPTLYDSNSYIDITICSAKLLLNKRHLSTLNYENDHRAVEVTIILDKELQTQQAANTDKIYVHKKTNWKMLREFLDQHHTNSPPDDVNLNSTQIDQYIEEIQNTIKKAIETITPTFKEKNHLRKFNNNKTKRLYQMKHSLQSKIHRYKQSQNIDELLINSKYEDILHKCNMNIPELDRLEDNYLINDTNSTIEVIGNFFGQINTAVPRDNSALETVIMKNVSDLKRNLATLKPIVEISANNKAHSPIDAPPDAASNQIVAKA